jgi:hypothetical protein
MMNISACMVLLALALGLSAYTLAQDAAKNEVIPDSIKEWQSEGKTCSYSQKTVFGYLDGGAEVYLAYGMKNVQAAKYTRPGEPSIDLSIFEMDEPDGAFGAFTYERLDAEAGIGQGSEYGGGMLRFWQGRYFVFIQAERENPASREAVLTLGKVLASRLGADAELPALPGALPQKGLRPLTVRHVLSPLILKNLERTLDDNPLGLPPRTAAVVGRYWKPGNPERILLARFSDESAAGKGVDAYLKARLVQVNKPKEPFKGPDGWSLVTASGSYAVLILDAPDAACARKQFEEITLKLKEISR